MTQEKKAELIPYLAYKESQKLNPEKYGNVSIEEWQNLIQENPDDINKIIEKAQTMSEEDWDALEEEYIEQTENVVQFAAKGAKLKKLKSMKKAKKCKCGCDMVSVKAAGGKMVERCACGCTAKKQVGGEIQNPVGTIAKNGTKVTKAQAGSKIKPKSKPITGSKDDETWSPDEIGTGNKSMNPKDWIKNKKETPVKKVPAKKIITKKEDGGKVLEKTKVGIAKCGGKAKKSGTKDRIGEAKLKK